MKKSVIIYSGFFIILISSLFLSCVSQGPKQPGSKPGAGQPMEPVPVSSDIQVWADENKNGRLEPGELEKLTSALYRLLKEGAHSAQNPLEVIFDRNKDGFIGPEERDFAREVFFRRQLMEMPGTFPQAARQIDFNDNGRIEPQETQLVIDNLFLAPEQSKPHKVNNPFDKRIDANRDGTVDEQELRQATAFIVSRTAAMPFPMEELAGGGKPMESGGQEGERIPVGNMLEKMADLNNDKFVGPAEREQLERSLGEPNDVRNPFDERIDFNKNGRVEPFEIERARQAAGIPVEQQFEFQEAPVRTPAEREIDLNEDGRITRNEIGAFVQVIAEGPRKVNPASRAQVMFDRNKDGFIQEEDIIITKQLFFLPHPVNPDWIFDRQSDINKDNFVSPEEIGIPAGFTQGREIPSFDALAEQSRWQGREPMADAGSAPAASGGAAASSAASSSSASAADAGFRDFQEKIKSIEDKKLAVVGISSTTKNVDSETTTGIMAFIKNAFVNIRKARVVERSAINRIIDEYKFQASGYVDENTAVEIGKLTGADIIVIGSVNYVGEKYYLNVKLISVLTAEIIGSSIAESSGSSEFYNMVNSAVLKLF
ncbi:MAG: hypothetical protein E4H36_05315 [Spirochaetales bacterium]|nr:MAG: hypothetical protein E4H36_05315 [Spirochaetales bacterium]